jgi:N-acylneuraminate cytidylyltransferase
MEHLVRKSIAVIPARKNSKRIPGKNIIDFKGRPMIAWTITAALESGMFDKVLVSTDSQEIAEISITHGASVPFLRKNNADEFSPSSQATLGALMQAEKYWNTRFDTVVQLMPNCPLRTGADIHKSMNVFMEKALDFQISVFKYGWINPWWALRLDDSGLPQNLFKNAFEKRSQDLENLYCPTGAVWIANRDSLVEAGSFYGPDYRVCELSWLSAVDIDDYNDLEMAAACFDIKHNGK